MSKFKNNKVFIYMAVTLLMLKVLYHEQYNFDCFWENIGIFQTFYPNNRGFHDRISTIKRFWELGLGKSKNTDGIKITL